MAQIAFKTDERNANAIARRRAARIKRMNAERRARMAFYASLEPIEGVDPDEATNVINALVSAIDRALA